MACIHVALPGSSASAAGAAGKEMFGMRRTVSAHDVRDRRRIRRCLSEPQIRCSVNPVKSKYSDSGTLWVFQFPFSSEMVRSLLFEETGYEEVKVEGKEEEGKEEEGKKKKKGNWVEQLLKLREVWQERQSTKGEDHVEAKELEEEAVCEVSYEEDELEASTAVVDRSSFARYLVPISWARMELFSRLAILCNMAYVVPEIKGEHLWEHHELVLVTSSLKKKAEAAAAGTEVEAGRPDEYCVPDSNSKSSILENDGCAESYKNRPLRPALAQEIAASAAKYVHTHSQEMASLGGANWEEGNGTGSGNGNVRPPERLGARPSSPASRVYNSGMAARVATSTMTSVVAAEEEAKVEAARNLRSPNSSPCEWFVCDDPSTFTRIFVIQGSDSLASWQTNLFFEPASFEGTEVLVHRGIYEAAKGIYDQFLPEIKNHLDKYGDAGKLRFAGHSLGGSLSLLVNLMLLTRKEMKQSSLLPVVTFGSPSVFCGGQQILRRLGLEEDHVCSVMMHRDIVPRAFSCDYPNRLAQVLKRLSGAFRSHPCLNQNKLLYAPLGQLFILQPDEESSPSHPLLPPGSAIYAVEKHRGEAPMAALRAFLNSPHPLETLSDLTAYGSDGTILRDHDSSNYLKAINTLLRRQIKRNRQYCRKERINQLWTTLRVQPSHTWVCEGSSQHFANNKELATEV